MDTLGCFVSILALLLHVATSTRVMEWFGHAQSSRSLPVILIIMIAAGSGLALGYFGYHRDWPRWANGRAISAVFIGGMLAVLTAFELVVRI